MNDLPTDPAGATVREVSGTEDTAHSEGSRGGPVTGQPLPEQVGRYRVRRELGRGGMGVVYLAYDEELDRPVAVKVLLTKALGADTSTAMSRMRREARAMAKLSHPNVVTIHEVGEHEGSIFLAMEFIEGTTLKKWLAGEPERALVLKVLHDAAQGLAAAHERGIVHRDFKPDNVLVGTGDRVKVLDFGLAGRAGERHEPDPEAQDEGGGASFQPEEPQLTQTGVIMGTPAYMAPEQFESSQTDERTDQFAFCIVLYEALYGARPFSGNSFQALGIAVLRGQIEPEPRGVDMAPALRAAMMRGLATEPGDRADDMGELLAALAPSPAGASSSGRSVAVFAGVGVFTLLLLGGGAYYAKTIADGQRALEEELQQARCDEPQRALDEMWGANVRGREILGMLASSGDPLEGYRSRLGGALDDTCSAERSDALTREEADARRQCLGHRRDELMSLLQWPTIALAGSENNGANVLPSSKWHLLGRMLEDRPPEVAEEDVDLALAGLPSVLPVEWCSAQTPQAREDYMAELRRKTDYARVLQKPPDEAPALTGVVRCDGLECEVPRSTLEAIIRDPGGFAAHARVVPAVKDGKTRGFKFYGVKPGSIPAAVGIKNGDLITTVDGIQLESLDAAMIVVGARRRRRLGKKLKDTERFEILLEREGQQLELAITLIDDSTPADGAVASEATPAEHAALSGALRWGVRCEEKKCTIPRTSVAAMLDNPKVLEDEARVVPALKDGEVRGFKFYGVEPGSLPGVLGVQNGDMLLSINGMDFDSVDAAMEAYGRLRRAVHLSARFEREGKPVEIGLEVVGEPSSEQ